MLILIENVMKRIITCAILLITSIFITGSLHAQAPKGQIQGYVVYANTINSPLSGVKVFLLNPSGQTLDSTTSAWNGSFLFRVHPGTYSFRLQIDLPWVHGAGNSLDALIALKHFVNLDTLRGLYYTAGNVNNTNGINATDALQIAQRFAGIINQFVIDVWVWQGDTVTVVNETPVQVVLRALISGDVNGSFIPFATPRPFMCGDTLTDPRDGRKYPTLQVGHQCWMGKNLNVGQHIPSTSTGGAHSDAQDNGVIEKYCYNNNAALCEVYGGLYDWNEAMQYSIVEGSRGICPPGWHLPTDAEWKELEANHDGTFWQGHPIWNTSGFRGSNAGGNMKATGTTHWAAPNTGATNLFGFNALPSGYRNTLGLFFGMGEQGYYWSSSLNAGMQAWYRHLRYDDARIARDASHLMQGFAVRCIWDTATLCWPYPSQANAGPDVFGIAGNTHTLQAVAPIDGTGTWEIISGTGGSLSNIHLPNGVLQGQFYQTYTLVWAVRTLCGVTTDTVVIDFGCVPMPDQANAGPDQSAIPGNSATLNANTPSAGTGEWSVVSGTGGSFSNVNDPQATFTGNFYQSYILSWTITTICGSTTDQVTIAFDCAPMPDQANAGPDVFDIPGNSIPMNANTPSAGYGAWTIISGTGGSFNDPGAAQSLFQGQFYETYTLVWTITTVCGSTSDTVVIGFSCVPMPDAANAGPDMLDIAADSVYLSANIPSAGAGQWSILAGAGGTLIDPANPATLFRGQFSTAYTLVWTITTICGSTSDTVEISFYTPPPFACGIDLLEDERDGRVYPTVQIGNQCWMAKNLNVGVMATSIVNSLIPHSDVTNNGIIEKYCYQNNIAYCDTFGGLYDWNEMMAYTTISGGQGICPEGWHVPSDADWKALEGAIDSQFGPGNPVWDNEGWRGSDAGAKMREAGTANWYIPNNGATNSSGFTALPAGYRYFDGSFLNKGYWAYYWSSDSATSTMAWYRSLVYFSQPINRDDYYKVFGFSVRCVMDVQP